MPARRALAGLAALWLGALGWALAAHVPVAPRAAAYAAYLLLPWALLRWAGAYASRRETAWALAAVLALWLPFELHALPGLPLAPRLDGSKLLAVLAGLWLFARVRPLPGMGLAWWPRPRMLPLALGAFVAFAGVAVPVGLATGFLGWHPQPSVDTLLVRPALIYAAIALPEELLFRALLQNLLQRALPPAAALGAAAAIFGLAHLPDPRYVVLATVAGVAYGLVWRRTGSIAASATTHALVDAVWVLLLRR